MNSSFAAKTPAIQQLLGWQKTATIASALPDCALIVPTYRRPKEMVRLLEAIAAITDPPGAFLVVDGSPDDTVNCALQQWATKRQLPFELVYVKSPAGLTRQRNVGLDICDKPFVFFLDDDCLPEPGYFNAIRQVFAADRNGNIGAVRGFLTNGIEKPRTLLWRLRLGLGIVPRGRPGEYHHCGTSGTWDMVELFTGTRPVDVLAGGVSAYRREVFEEHRFSEFFYGYAQGEDLEMSLRIGKDWKLLVCGDARVDHRHAESGRPAGIPRGRMAVRNRYFIWRRHSPQPGLVNRVRFWADHALTVAYYAAAFLARPSRPYHLAFACGTIMGVVECIFSPPQHDELAARKQYAVTLRELNCSPLSKSTA